MDAETATTVKQDEATQPLVEAPTKTGAELTRELVAEDFDLQAHKNKPQAAEPVVTWTPNGDCYEDGDKLRLELRVAYETKGRRRITKVFARLTPLDPSSAMKVKHAAFRQFDGQPADEIEATKAQMAADLRIANPTWQIWIDGVKQVSLVPLVVAQRDIPKLSDALGALAAALDEDANLKAIAQHIRTARGRLVRAIDELAKVAETAAAV